MPFRLQEHGCVLSVSHCFRAGFSHNSVYRKSGKGCIRNQQELLLRPGNEPGLGLGTDSLSVSGPIRPGLEGLNCSILLGCLRLIRLAARYILRKKGGRKSKIGTNMS